MPARPGWHVLFMLTVDYSPLDGPAPLKHGTGTTTRDCPTGGAPRDHGRGRLRSTALTFLPDALVFSTRGGREAALSVVCGTDHGGSRELPVVRCRSRVCGGDARRDRPATVGRVGSGNRTRTRRQLAASGGPPAPAEKSAARHHEPHAGVPSRGDRAGCNVHPVRGGPGGRALFRLRRAFFTAVPLETRPTEMSAR